MYKIYSLLESVGLEASSSTFPLLSRIHMEIIKATIRILQEDIVDQLIHAFHQVLQKSVELRLVSLDNTCKSNYPHTIFFLHFAHGVC